MEQYFELNTYSNTFSLFEARYHVA